MVRMTAEQHSALLLPSERTVSLERVSLCGAGFLVLQVTDESELSKEQTLMVSLCKFLSTFVWLLLI